MHPTRIAGLLAPFLGDAQLSPAQLDQLSRYLDLLVKWNQRMNLTAVRDPDYIVKRHVGESLFAARVLLRGTESLPISHDPPPTAPPATGDRRLLDLGSGAGFPGLPIALYAPALAVTLVESNQRKATFLREAVRTTGLSNVEVFSGRAEDCPARGAIVTLRAVEKFDLAVTIAANLLAGPGARLALLIGDAQIPTARAALPHLAWSHPIPMPQSSARVLLIGTRER